MTDARQRASVTRGYVVDGIISDGRGSFASSGGKLSGNLQSNGFKLIVRDVDKAAAEPLLANGAEWADSPKVVAESAPTTYLDASCYCTQL
jgi:hypothetical protein